MNKSKQKGTAFETKLVKLFKEHGVKAERLPLNGAADQGDICVTYSNGKVQIIEAKSHKSFTRKDQRAWLKQAEKEGENYRETHKDLDYIYPILIIDQYGKSLGSSLVCYDKQMMYLDDYIQTQLI
jgi:23S rRNA G2069 N7-methylase RlmK/C1962 C5-methylase RlmI